MSTSSSLQMFQPHLNVSGTKSSIGASNPSSKTVTCTATINPFSATLNINPSSVSETYDQNEVIVAQQITITQSNLSDIVVSAIGDYEISSTQNGVYTNIGNLTNIATTFWVKLKSTSVVGTLSGVVTLTGNHRLGGGSTIKTLSCSATINEVDTGGGDGGPCEECKPELNFDFHTDRLGGTDTAIGTNNYTINGFESGGSLALMPFMYQHLRHNQALQFTPQTLVYLVL